MGREQRLKNATAMRGKITVTIADGRLELESAFEAKVTVRLLLNAALVATNRLENRPESLIVVPKLVAQ